MLMVFGVFFSTGIEFLGIAALFIRFGSIRGWTLAQIGFFYGTISIAFALAEALGRGFDSFDRIVKSGDFDRLLLRPQNTAFQVAAAELQLMRIGRFAVGLCVLWWSLERLGIPWNPLKISLLCFTIFGGLCLFYGLFVLQATIAFWTIESLELINIVTYGGVETAQYPLTIYPDWFRRFFTYLVPFACINYIPLGLLLSSRRIDLLADVGGILAPGVGVLFLMAMLQFWKFGVRHYCSTGS